MKKVLRELPVIFLTITLIIQYFINQITFKEIKDLQHQVTMLEEQKAP